MRPVVLSSFHLSLTSEGTDRETQSYLHASLPEGGQHSLRNWKVSCDEGAMDSNLKKTMMHIPQLSIHYTEDTTS